MVTKKHWFYSVANLPLAAGSFAQTTGKVILQISYGTTICFGQNEVAFTSIVR